MVQTAQEVAKLREAELQYYVDHIGAVQTMATLLAGFAFSAIISMDSISIDLNAILLRQASDSFVISNDSGEVAPGDAQAPNALQVLTFSAHVIQTLFFVLCLGEMMHVMTETLVARQLGSRLALHGPDGSIITATHRLAASLASATKRFFSGLQYFLLSVVFNALRGMHPGLALVVALVILAYLRGQGALVAKLALDFELRSAIHTGFHNDSSRPTSPCLLYTSPSPRDS